MMTTVLLVRHGETPFHAENRYCGSTDVSITDTGRQQAQVLAGWAAEAGLDAVYSSTLRRSVETALPAASAAGVPLRRDDRLVELDFGEGEGLTPAQMSQRWPEARAAFVADPVSHPLPGGEDPHRAMDRGVAAVSDIVADFPAGVVLVVCHGTLLRLLTCRLCGFDPSSYRRRFPKVANTSGAVLRKLDDWSLTQFNPVLRAGGYRIPD